MKKHESLKACFITSLSRLNKNLYMWHCLVLLCKERKAHEKLLISLWSIFFAIHTHLTGIFPDFSSGLIFSGEIFGKILKIREM